MKKMNKKGFTLIEIIVVIVVLAVLMAVSVPSVLKYINEADNAKYMAQGRSVMTIAQTEVIKGYVGDNTLDKDDLTNIKNAIMSMSGKDGMGKIVEASIEIYAVGETETSPTLPTISTAANGTLSGLIESQKVIDTTEIKTSPILIAVSYTYDNDVKVIAMPNDKIYVGK